MLAVLKHGPQGEAAGGSAQQQQRRGACARARAAHKPKQLQVTTAPAAARVAVAASRRVTRGGQAQEAGSRVRRASGTHPAPTPPSPGTAAPAAPTASEATSRATRTADRLGLAAAARAMASEERAVEEGSRLPRHARGCLEPAARYHSPFSRVFSALRRAGRQPARWSICMLRNAVGGTSNSCDWAQGMNESIQGMSAAAGGSEPLGPPLRASRRARRVYDAPAQSPSCLFQTPRSRPHRGAYRSGMLAYRLAAYRLVAAVGQLQRQRRGARSRDVPRGRCRCAHTRACLEEKHVRQSLLSRCRK